MKQTQASFVRTGLTLLIIIISVTIGMSIEESDTIEYEFYPPSLTGLILGSYIAYIVQLANSIINKKTNIMDAATLVITNIVALIITYVNMQFIDLFLSKRNLINDFGLDKYNPSIIAKAVYYATWLSLAWAFFFCFKKSRKSKNNISA